MRRSTLPALLALAACALLLAGCGQSAGEKAIEKSSGAKNVAIEKDGRVKIEDGKGNKIETSGEGEATLPADWPADEVALPDGAKITVASSLTQDGEQSMTVSATTELSPTEVLAFFKRQLKGWTQELEMTQADGGAVASYINAEHMLAITVSTPDEGQTSEMTLVLGPPRTQT